MTDQNQSVKDDIAFMRSLAEAGANAPMAGGSILFAAGVIYGVAALITVYASANGLITNGLFFPIVWFGATALFMLCLFLLKGQAQSRTDNGRASGLAFTGAGWSIFAIIVALMLMSYRGNDWYVMSAAAPIITAIYGGGWFVAAAVSRVRWLYAVAAGSLISAPVMAWYATQPTTEFLIYGVVLLGLLALPGFILMQRARAA